jgi:hypothetical protein
MKTTFALLATLTASSSALAADVWTDPFPGVRRLHRSGGGQNVNAAVIDLCRPGVSLRVTASSERRQTVSSFASAVGAEVAVNGDFFNFTDYATDGFTVHDGQQWPGSGDHTYTGQLFAGVERIGLVHHQDVISPAPWMREAISGHPTLLWNGVVEDNSGDTGLCTARHPRTAVGLSRDRRTLIIAVVDGRASSRVGMTCAELSTLMKDLGAWTAMALDGGGSSTMWMAGAGVVNFPSDGRERVVGNHLAVSAKGVGEAAHCDRGIDETFYQQPVVSAEGSTDLDGDGTADACIRGRDGVTCATSTGARFSTPMTGPALADAANWWWPTYSQSLRFADFTGDGKADLCARFDDGLRCWPSTGTGFGAEVRLPALTNEAGWGALDTFPTFALVDVTGDGRADWCGRTAARLRCYASTGAGFSATPIEGPAMPSADGWDDPSRFGTLRFGDVNGDGKQDVCARDDVYMRCWLSDGRGFPRAVQGPAWPTLFGFGDVRYWSTIRLADVNADGKADLCTRTSMDYRCYLSTGEGFGDAIIGPPLVDFFFERHRYYSTLRLADVDGDRDLDVCVRTGHGIRCWTWDGAGFGTTALEGPPLSDATGWGGLDYYRSIRFADVNADGKADVCARSVAGLHCWLSNGRGFPTQVDGPAWSDAAGFGGLLYPPSLRIAGGGPRCRPVAEVCGNAVDDDCDGVADEGCATTTPPTATAPTPTDVPVKPDVEGPRETPAEATRAPGGGLVTGGCSAGGGEALVVALVLLLVRRR